jgi:predicted nucleotidyltransferase
MLTLEQIDTVRELEGLWPQRSWVIVGATALGFYHEMTWRKTADVDLAVALELDEFPAGLSELDGWSRTPGREHEFVSSQGVRLDVLPAGRSLLEAGSLTWSTGQVMNLTGLDLAFEYAEAHTVARDVTVRVAPPKAIAVLKMVSFLDRPNGMRPACCGKGSIGEASSGQRLQ